MFTTKETGESLICSTCQEVILDKPNKFSDDFVKLRYLQHKRNCSGKPPKRIEIEIEPEDIYF